MREIKPPTPLPERNAAERYLFLAGSIEMGQASEWQEVAVDALKDSNWTILNPRRDAWNASWKQEIGNPVFREQVEWELKGQEMADRILMYLDPLTKAPVSLLELGLFAHTGKLLVIVPTGYWRKGNVDIVCKRYNVAQLNTLEEAIKQLREEAESGAV